MHTFTAAGPLIGVAGFLLLAVTSAILVSRDARATAKFYALAAIPEAMVAILLAIRYGHADLYFVAAAILVAKGWGAPHLLTRVWPERERLAYRLSGTVGTVGSLLTVLLVTAVAFRVGAYALPGPDAVGFAASLAAGMAGMAAPALRHELFSQAGGLLVAEAGISTAALLLVGSFPVAADVVAFADLLVLSAAFGLLLRDVARVHGRADAALLRRLRG